MYPEPHVNGLNIFSINNFNNVIRMTYLFCDYLSLSVTAVCQKGNARLVTNNSNSFLEEPYLLNSCKTKCNKNPDSGFFMG